jgi:aldehyde dehydrogenase (NAD+)
MSTRDIAVDLLERLGVDPAAHDLDGMGELEVTSPIDGAPIGRIMTTSEVAVDFALADAAYTFQGWRAVPPPRRGELVRLFGLELREAKDDLGALVSLEVGKILAEGRGEVQEMIDICDLAVGQSRQLFGRTIASERAGHRMMETWQPLGPVAVISAFNFPVAVWAWNATLAWVCGNPVVWKPSEAAPLSALACHSLFLRAANQFAAGSDDAFEDWSGLSQVVIGGREIGEQIVGDERIALVSATGSTGMGRAVGTRAAERLAPSLLELGGNNAMIVAPSADLDLAERAVLFSAVGTAGQRCTSLRRLIVHSSVKDELVDRLVRTYGSLPIGDPLAEGTLVGPLIASTSLERMTAALTEARDDGGKVLVGGDRVLEVEYPDAAYVAPAIVDMPEQTDIVRTETFAPILYVLTYETLDDAIEMNNDVPQGLSSCIFTLDVREAERFVSAMGSDCGIANVNIGPSGAEIGGAFGGQKDTGGGRESGSDAWKAYMRRQTVTVNWSTELPLAQGITFG